MKTINAKVSVIITTYNKKEKLRNCLNSLLQQTKKPDEIIVVDDNSTDGTSEMIKKEFPAVKLISHNKNKGCCASFNDGIRNAKYEYIAMLDDDVILPKDWIERMLEEIVNEPEVALISGKHYDDRYQPETLEPYYSHEFNGGICLARKAALMKTDLYTEKFFIHVNELDLAAKLINEGYKIKRCPAILSHHDRDFSKSKRRLYYYTRNMLWYLWKYYPIKYAILLSFIYLTDYLIKAIKWRMINEYLKGIFDALRGMDEVIKNRKVCYELVRLRKQLRKKTFRKSPYEKELELQKK
jgi:hypothetical protein